MDEVRKELLVFGIVMAILLVAWAAQTLYDSRPKLFGRLCLGLIGLGILALLALLTVHFAHARDLDGRYAQSPLKPWFDELRNKWDWPCCSDADGAALSDVDWDTSDGHYRVRIDGEWMTVPDEAVVTVPNLAGRTMVWPMREPDGRISIRCFMPGSMS